MTAASVEGKGTRTATAEGRAARNARVERPAVRRRRHAPAIITAVGILALWHLVVVVFEVPTYIAPTPIQVLQVFVEQGDILWINFWPTLLEAVAGFALGNSIAVVLAVWFVHNRLAERAFYPIAVFINTIPIIAVAPILVLMLGNGYAPKIVIAALICFFPTLVNMVRGLKAVSPQMLELMRVLSASDREILWKIRLQSSLPFLFAALKIASTTCVIGAIVGEWIGSNYGLGSLIIEATYNFRAPSAVRHRHPGSEPGRGVLRDHDPHRAARPEVEAGRCFLKSVDGDMEPPRERGRPARWKTCGPPAHLRAGRPRSRGIPRSTVE